MYTSMISLNSKLKGLTQMGVKGTIRLILRNLFAMDHVYILKHNLHRLPEQSLRKWGNSTLRLCDEQHISQLLQEVIQLDYENRRELASSLRLWNTGFRGCYVLEEDGKVVYLQWLFLPADSLLLKKHFRTRYLPLGPSTAMIENAFTFPDHRGRGFQLHATMELLRLAGNQGCETVVTYIRKKKIGSINSCISLGFKITALITEFKFFGFAWLVR